MALGRPAWQEARATLQKILSKDEVSLFEIDPHGHIFVEESCSQITRTIGTEIIRFSNVL